jgi:predicted DNA-binding transcriptional regulator YafY
MKMGKENPPLIFKYKNWEGKEAVRKVRPMKIWYGKTEWHPEEQWLLKAWDLDKDAERNFALKDIIQFFTEEPAS